mmetsp:Transcript_21129/g.34981  ORF Transcript_21129/g.34981 Transcript_21129/m.34981 type:complete len:219 (+) Transcript_21129:863-1519(+)
MRRQRGPQTLLAKRVGLPSNDAGAKADICVARLGAVEGERVPGFSGHALLAHIGISVGSSADLLLQLKLSLLVMLHGKHHLFHAPQHVQFQTPHALLHRLVNLGDLGLQGTNGLSQIGYFLRVVLGGMSTTTASRALDFLEEITAPTLELLVVKGNVLGRVYIKVRVANRFGLHLSETVKIKLTRKRGKLIVVKILGDNCSCKEIWVLNNKHLAIWSP